MKPLCFEFPLRTTTGLNAREHWRTRAKRVAFERERTRSFLGRRMPRRGAADPRLLVTITRISPASKQPDDDNLAGGLKAVRDAVGEWLGTGDAPDAPVSWAYRAERGQWSVRVVIEEEP